VGSPPAVINAIVDALARHRAGLRHIDMPATPDRVWQLLNEAAVTQ
jgi:carbon-monoxide dehydrogenase large subunit